MANQLRKLVKKERELKGIYSDDIVDGVLRIPSGCTTINRTLEDLMGDLAILIKVKAVVFPESLTSIGNFFYGYEGIELAVFYNPVTLFSNKHQGTFEKCSIEKIIVRGGFNSISTVAYNKRVSFINIKGEKDSDSVGKCFVPTSFSNCHSLKKISVFDPDCSFPQRIYTTFCRNYPHCDMEAVLKSRMGDPAQIELHRVTVDEINYSQIDEIINDLVKGRQKTYKAE
jgi:hypothetical protein